jgi:peptidoglycan/LPS O-acetylase OafA/YrhL
MKQTFYLPELDTLHFFAFLAVFLCHYALAGHPVGLLISGMTQVSGHGIDLFFALSAYLLTELMLREKEETGHVNLVAFYARRGLRIWPLYYVYLTLVFVASLKWPSPSMSPAHFGSPRSQAICLEVRLHWYSAPCGASRWRSSSIWSGR